MKTLSNNNVNINFKFNPQLSISKDVPSSTSVAPRGGRGRQVSTLIYLIAIHYLPLFSLLGYRYKIQSTPSLRNKGINPVDILHLVLLSSGLINIAFLIAIKKDETRFCILLDQHSSRRRLASVNLRWFHCTKQNFNWKTFQILWNTRSSLFCWSRLIHCSRWPLTKEWQLWTRSSLTIRELAGFITIHCTAQSHCE